ncbi:hypothetical protein EDB83DRAFT_2609692 [Lactarius deliciosus]|nr:hypothetical protein EDB83DRAFT_2609692 [Lactarius deliciosus]
MRKGLPFFCPFSFNNDDMDFEQLISKLEQGATADEIKGYVALAKASVAKTKTFAFSSISLKHLKEMNIVKERSIVLKPDYKERAITTREIGDDKLWSSSTLWEHLGVLKQLVPPTNETAARAHIDAIFFRVSAMVPTGKRLVLNLEHVIPPITVQQQPTPIVLSGTIDYTAVIASQRTAEEYFYDPTLENLQALPCGFFIIEAKFRSAGLIAHLPQAIGEMFACLKTLGKTTLRGALTTGTDWLFLVLTLNPDGNGAKYRHSVPIQHDSKRDSSIWADLVASILLYWIEHGDRDIGSDDWYT